MQIAEQQLVSIGILDHMAPSKTASLAVRFSLPSNETVPLKVLSRIWFHRRYVGLPQDTHRHSPHNHVNTQRLRWPDLKLLTTFQDN